jgi:hypothetical protein
MRGTISKNAPKGTLAKEQANAKVIHFQRNSHNSTQDKLEAKVRTGIFGNKPE